MHPTQNRRHLVSHSPLPARQLFDPSSLQFLNELTHIGLQPKPHLVASALTACARAQRLRLGRAIHARYCLNSDAPRSVLLQTSLLDMYSKCTDIRSAFAVFNGMAERNTVTWTAMVSACVRNEMHHEAIDLVRRMRRQGIGPVRATAVAVLPACAGPLGREVHAFAYRRGFESEPRVATGLVSVYAKCAGGFARAIAVFERAERRDVVSWGSIMEAASRAGDGIRTFELFGRMRREGIAPNSVAMLAVVEACVALALLDCGGALLGFIMKSGFLSDVCLGNSLIDMFARCGCVDSSARVFDELMIARDSISYSSMIRSYGLHGRGRKAIGLFEEMRELGLEVDGVALLAVLSACNHSGLVAEARTIFDSANGLNSEHYSCYVDLLGKVGMIEEAFEVVKKMRTRPSASLLSSLASACRVHGKLAVAAELATELIKIEPGNTASYALLSAVYAEGANWDCVEGIRRAMRERGLRKGSGSSRI